MHRSRHSHSATRLRRRGQGFALGVAVLAFAAALPWGSVGFFESRLVAAAAWLAGMAGIAWTRSGGENGRSAASGPALAAVALLAAWCACQLVPLPAGWAVHFWQGDAALLKEIVGAADGWPIALDRFVSLHAALLWAGLGILAWACSRGLRGRRALQTVLSGLVSLGVFQSILGLFILRDTAGRVCGTFGSPNALGGLLAMTLPLTLGLGLSHVHRRILRGRTGLRWWFQRLGDSWQAWLRPLVWTALGIQWVALYFSGSIGATISAVVACGMLLVWQGKERPESRPWIVAMGVLLVVSTLAFGLHARRLSVWDRALGDSGEFQSSKMSRVEIWRAAWRLCRAFPCGTGPGGTALALPMYQSAVHGRFRLDYAHNDTLQFLGDLGLPGFVPLAFLLGLVLWRGAKASRRPPGQEGYPVWLIRGTWLAAIAALMHAQVEFNLSARPGNQWIFAILCGILWGGPGASFPQMEAPDPKMIRPGTIRSAIIALGAAALWLSLSTAWAWRLQEGVVAAVGLPLDEYLWFRRPVVPPEGIPEAMRLACRLAPGSSRLRQTAAEARTVLHRRRIQELAQTLIPSGAADLAAEAPLDPADSVHEEALGSAALALRLEEAETLRASLADADAAVRLAPWNASARCLRGRIFLRGAALNQFGPDAETRGHRDLELAVALYPMDAGVLAVACSALSRGTHSDRDQELLLDWGARALALDSSLAWTVLDAWWAGRVRVVRVLERPELPVAVLWNLYARLEKLNRTRDARQCLAMLERRLDTDPPPEASSIWTSSMWKHWNLLQTQHRIHLAGEWLKRNLREGNWEAVEASAPVRAKARHDRFQMELDRMELSGAASRVLRRLRLREWAARGELSPEWTVEWVLMELEASTPIRQIQDPLADVILVGGLDAARLDRLSACRSALIASPFLASLLDAQEADLSGRPEKAVAVLASLSESGQVPDRLAHRIWLWRSRLLHRIGDAEAAAVALDEAAQRCFSDPDVQSARAGFPDAAGESMPEGMPALDLGFWGGRLMLERVGLEPVGGAAKETLLHLRWRFLGELPSDLRMDVRVRDEDGHARARKAVALDQEETAKFNRGRPPLGSTWTWTIPLSSFAAKARMVEVRVRSAGKILPSDDGVSAIELNMEKLPRASRPEGAAER